jgi:hypothetical protein
LKLLMTKKASEVFPDKYHYKADCSARDLKELFSKDAHWNWRPSIHMPKEAARIFLKVTGVRLERLQEIRYPDVYAEGINEEYGSLTDFVELWDSISDKRGFGWESNPWVWVIEFERCEKPKGWC